MWRFAAIKKKKHALAVFIIGVYIFSYYSLVWMVAAVRGGKAQGGHREGKQIFFDLLELKASWVT